MEITIQVVCTRLPGTTFVESHNGEPLVRGPVHLGIQRGDEIVAAVPADRKRVVFEPVFRVAEQANGTAGFYGPYAKGTPRERFFYLSWSIKREDGELEMFRRAKIHLSHLAWPHVEAAVSDGRPIRVELEMTDQRGAPRCGSIREDQARWDP